MANPNGYMIMFQPVQHTDKAVKDGLFGWIPKSQILHVIDRRATGYTYAIVPVWFKIKVMGKSNWHGTSQVAWYVDEKEIARLVSGSDEIFKPISLKEVLEDV